MERAICFCKYIVDIPDVAAHVSKHLETEAEGVKIYVMHLVGKRHLGGLDAHRDERGWILIRAYNAADALAQANVEVHPMDYNITRCEPAPGSDLSRVLR